MSLFSGTCGFNEQTPGDGEGQGSLAYCSPWVHKELDMTEQLNSSNKELALGRARGRGARGKRVRLGGHTCVLGLTEEKKKWSRSEQESKNVGEKPKSQGEECRY